MQSSEQVNNIAPNYSPEVETENHLQENVKKTIWTERSCVSFDETAIVKSLIGKNRVIRKFAHAHIAILASSYSDDVIAIEVKK